MEKIIFALVTVALMGFGCGARVGAQTPPPPQLGALGDACGANAKIKDCGRALFCQFDGNSAAAAGTCADGLAATKFWNSYTNSQFKYSFKYPKGMTVTEQAPESVVVADAYGAKAQHGVVAVGETLSGNPSLVSDQIEKIMIDGVSGAVYHIAADATTGVSASDMLWIMPPATQKFLGGQVVQFRWSVDADTNFVFYTMLKTWKWGK